MARPTKSEAAPRSRSAERDELSPMIRQSLRQLVRQHPQVDRVDRWDRFRKLYSLLFGFAHIFCMDKSGRFIAVHVCPMDEVDEIKLELRHSGLVRRFLEAGARLLIHGWRRGEDGRLLHLREAEVFRRDLCFPYCQCPGATAEYMPPEDDF